MNAFGISNPFRAALSIDTDGVRSLKNVRALILEGSEAVSYAVRERILLSAEPSYHARGHANKG